MKWFYGLKRKLRVLITVVSWLPLFISASVIGAVLGHNTDNMNGGQAAIVIITLAVGIFFTVYAVKATKREKDAIKAEQKEKADAQAKADAEARAAKYIAENPPFSVRIVGGRESADGFPIHTKVKGVTFEGRQEFLAVCDAGDPLTIEHAPTAEYPNSICVINDRTGDTLGNIASGLATSLLERYGDGCTFVGKISEITGGEDGLNYGCNIVINGLES